MTLRPRLLALVASVVLLPAVAVGPAMAQDSISDPPEFGGTTTSTVPSGGSTTSARPTTTTTPEITAAQAGDGILLSAEDRVELASTLAEATEESGVCFTYRVSLGGTGAADRDETLSNAGPDRTPTDCPKGTVTLQVGLTYTSSSSESEDSASYSVSADAAGAPPSPTGALRDVSGVSEDDLLGDDDDLALRNLAAALPLILEGATPAQLAAPAASAPNGDRLTGSPGGDWIRAHGLGIGIAFVLLVLAVVLVLGGLVARRQAGRPARPTGGGTRPSSSGSDGPTSSTTTP